MYIDNRTELTYSSSDTITIATAYDLTDAISAIQALESVEQASVTSGAMPDEGKMGRKNVLVVTKYAGSPSWSDAQIKLVTDTMWNALFPNSGQSVPSAALR